MASRRNSSSVSAICGTFSGWTKEPTCTASAPDAITARTYSGGRFVTVPGDAGSLKIYDNGSYTYAKVIDDTQGQAGADNAGSSIFGLNPSRPSTSREATRPNSAPYGIIVDARPYSSR